ncbi:hypothetical protein SLA2020_280550 [Shorea laevis]
MAGGRGRGRVAELTQRLAAQNLERDREMDDRDSDSSFENPYHNPVLDREQRGRDERYGNLGFKVELPEFSGTLQAEGFIDWLHEVERIFDYKEVSDRMKVKLVAIKLKGRASAWWEQLKRSRDRQGKPKICDWEKMKKKMKGHFLPFGYTQALFQRLHTLRQGVRSIDDYTEEFYQLVARNDLSETEEQLVARYLGGLRQSLQDVLSLHSLWTVSEAYQRALTVEKQQARSNTRSTPRGDHNTRGIRPQEPRPNPQPTEARAPTPTSVVSNVGSPVIDRQIVENLIAGRARIS